MDPWSGGGELAFRTFRAVLPSAVPAVSIGRALGHDCGMDCNYCTAVVGWADGEDTLVE